ENRACREGGPRYMGSGCGGDRLPEPIPHKTTSRGVPHATPPSAIPSGEAVRPMIGFTPSHWQELRERYRNLPDLDKEWAMYIQRDSDGMVHCSPLLSGMVSTWASEIMEQDLR